MYIHTWFTPTVITLQINYQRFALVGKQINTFTNQRQRERESLPKASLTNRRHYTVFHTHFTLILNITCVKAMGEDSKPV